MHLKTFHIGPLDSCVYFLADSGEAMVIDPAKGSVDKVIDEATKIRAAIRIIVNTHGHWDHIADNQPLHKATEARIVCHKHDEEYLLHPGQQGFDLPFDINPTLPHYHLWEGSTIVIGSLRFKVLHTPGHTPGSICLYEEKGKVLFTGDTLFSGTYGRTDFQGSSEKDMFLSLKKLAKLPEDVVVYPGHGARTTIREEKKWILNIP